MPPNQSQYHQPQQQQQQQPQQVPPQQQSSTIYATQMPQASYGSNQVWFNKHIFIYHIFVSSWANLTDLLYWIQQNVSQYNQPIYVSSNSNQNLSQQQLNNAPIPNQNGPIYVSSNVASQPNMIMPGYSAVNSNHNIAQEQGMHFICKIIGNFNLTACVLCT